MLVVTRFDVPESEGAQFRVRAEQALAAFAARPGFLRGRVGRSADDASQWILSTEWTGVGAYRRSLSGYDVKVHAAPLLSQGRDEPSAFEILLTVDPDGSSAAASRRAVDADVVGIGAASAPSVPGGV